MGLDISHECWHGTHSAFHRWRQAIAKAAELPPLEFMEGFYGEDYRNPIYFARLQTGNQESFKDITDSLPIKWNCICEDYCSEALFELLSHSDYDGEIKWEICKDLAESLKKLLPVLPEGKSGHINIFKDFKDKTQQFIDGLLLAYKNKENVEFY